MASDISLIRPKENLDRVLGSNRQKYWSLMRQWYKNQLTREQLNADARELLGEGNLSLHNEFFLALLLKCQLGGRAGKNPGTPGPSLPRPAFRRVRPEGSEVRAVRQEQLVLSSQTGLLPDEEGLTVRVLTGAWEAGVDEVSSDTLPLFKLALQMFVQGILTDCVRESKRRELTEHGVSHGFNQPPDNPSLPSLIAMRHKGLTEGQNTRITIPHLIEALKRVKRRRIAEMGTERALSRWSDKLPSTHESLANKTLHKMYNKDIVAQWQDIS